MDVERWPDGHWLVRFTSTIDLAEPGVLESLDSVLRRGCRRLWIDLSGVSSVSLFEIDSLYALRATAMASGAAVEVLHAPPILKRLLEALDDEGTP